MLASFARLNRYASITDNPLQFLCHMCDVHKSEFEWFQAKDVKVSEVDFNPEFVSRIIPKLDWSVLWGAAESVSYFC
jgi:uncharacterized membrane protein